ncbi:MAG: RNA methyltransferase [Proteobacteria bacterium]|nr:RNA methyltransferase [Pseudomonadota bacterium]NIS68096.1 RNA methyltransferase [Pseudomonadota bacterium]
MPLKVQTIKSKQHFRGYFKRGYGGEHMAYNEKLEARIQKIVSSWKNTDDKKMFGGVCHLLRGNMFCGVYKDFLIARLGEKEAQQALESPFVKPFDITGRPMKGWVMVEGQGFNSDRELEVWLDKARAFVEALPSK